jgi:hypothetical protein
LFKRHGKLVHAAFDFLGIDRGEPICNPGRCRAPSGVALSDSTTFLIAFMNAETIVTAQPGDRLPVLDHC